MLFLTLSLSVLCIVSATVKGVPDTNTAFIDTHAVTFFEGLAKSEYEALDSLIPDYSK